PPLSSSSDPPPTTELSPLSLHDALPISRQIARSLSTAVRRDRRATPRRAAARVRGLIGRESAASLRARTIPSSAGSSPAAGRRRSEEHTSELQSRFDLVCRLLLEKKKIV